MATQKIEEISPLRIKRWEEKMKGFKERRRFTAKLSDKSDRYNYKICIPTEYPLPSNYKKATMYPIETDSSNPSERLFNIEFQPKELLDDEPAPRQIIISKRFCNKNGLILGDEIEVIEMWKGNKMIFFCSDISKNEQIDKAEHNVFKAMKKLRK